MDLTKSICIINKLNFCIDSDYSIVVKVADSLNQQEKRKQKKKEDFLQAITNINELKIDHAYSFEKEFQENHPILGNLENNIFFEKPLFESIQVGMKEPQYTTALGWFLQKDQKACRLFIETLREMIQFPPSFVFPAEDTTIESIWEYSNKQISQNEDDEIEAKEHTFKETQVEKEIFPDVAIGDDVKNHKEIDNLLIRECNGRKYGIIIEIKFGAGLHNDLSCYQQSALKKMCYPVKTGNKKGCSFFSGEKLECQTCLDNIPVICVVLSTNRISPQEIQANNGCQKLWQRVLWCHFMPKLNKKITQYQGDKDYKRFLSSLWRKAFETKR